MLISKEVMLLRYSKTANIVTLSFLTVSLLTTSFGGAFASTALAATPEVSIQEEKGMDSKGLIGGIAVIGLLSLLSNHGGGHDNAASLIKTSEPSTPSTSSAGQTGTTVGTPPPVTNSGYSADEKHAFDLLNADRAKNGLKPLKFNLQLTALGGKYAQDMINRKFFAHNDPDGKTPFDRMKQAGISYSYAGENLAINSNVTTAEQAFMNSPGHRANILSPNYTDVGLGVRYDAKGSAYVVQEFIGK